MPGMELRGRLDESGPINTIIAVALSVGFGLGCLTIVGLYLLNSATWYGWVLSPDKSVAWKGPTVLIASAVLIVVLYLIAVRSEATPVANWMVLGYAIALSLAAGLLVSHEMYLILRDHIPQDLGVKTAGVTGWGLPAALRAGWASARS